MHNKEAALAAAEARAKAVQQQQQQQHNNNSAGSSSMLPPAARHATWQLASIGSSPAAGGGLPAARRGTAGSVAAASEANSLYNASVRSSDVLPLMNKSATAGQVVASFWSMAYSLNSFLQVVSVGG